METKLPGSMASLNDTVFFFFDAAFTSFAKHSLDTYHVPDIVLGSSETE